MALTHEVDNLECLLSYHVKVPGDGGKVPPEGAYLLCLPYAY